MTPEFRSTSSPASRNWKRSGSKSKILNRQFTRTGILFVLSAPSGAGKTTLCNALRQTPDFVYSVSCTTRPQRAGEIEGEDYFFISEPEFLAKVEAREFLEYARVHEHYYGTLRQPICGNLASGVDVLIDIDTQGASSIRNYDDAFVREALCDVFIMPPDLEELRRRLVKRATDTDDEIELRLTNAAREMEFWREYRYTIISKSMEEDL